MSNLITKIAIGFLFVTPTIGTGGLFIYRNLSIVTVRQKLQEESKLKILDDQSQESDWEEIKSNNSSQQETRRPLKKFIKRHNGITEVPDSDIVEELKKACKHALEEKVYETNIETAKKYCTKSIQ